MTAVAEPRPWKRGERGDRIDECGAQNGTRGRLQAAGRYDCVAHEPPIDQTEEVSAARGYEVVEQPLERISVVRRDAQVDDRPARAGVEVFGAPHLDGRCLHWHSMPCDVDVRLDLFASSPPARRHVRPGRLRSQPGDRSPYACENAYVETDRRWPAWKVGYFVLMATLGVAALFVAAFFAVGALSGGSLI